MFIPLILLFLLLVYPSGSEATENLSNSHSSSEWPAVEVNSNGLVMVVWTEWNSGNMFYRTLKDGQWSSMTNAGIVRKRAWSNQLALDSAGIFHVDYADGVSSAAREIYYSYYKGSSWATAEAIYISPHNSAWNKIAIDGNDKIYAAWYHSHVPKDTDPSADIAVNSKNKGGSWPSNIENASKTKNVVSIHPALAVRNGNVYTAWMEGENPRKLFFNEKTGGSWKTASAIEDKGSYYPDMVVDNSGNLYIVFSNRSGNFYCKSRVAGQWGAKHVISSGKAPLQFGDINYSNNTIVAGWSQGQDGVYAVYVSHKKPGGSWSTPVRVSPHDSVSNKHVSVALDKDGYVHAVWEGAGVGGEKDIFYSKTRLGEPTDDDSIIIDKSFLKFVTDPGSNPPPQNFQLKASGDKPLDYDISTNKDWLAVYPQSGTATKTWDNIEVSVDVDDFSPGTYNGKITIVAPEAANSPVEIGITVVVGTQNIPFIMVSNSHLRFWAYVGMGNPTSQTFDVKNAGTGILNFELTPDKPWIQVAPTKASSNGDWVTITVNVDASSKGVDIYQGQIQIKASGAENSPQYVDVDLEIKRSPLPYPPVNVNVQKIDHVGLMIREYKNKVSWQNNPLNRGRFVINKYRIFRRDRYALKSSFAYIAEVGANVLSYYDGDFDSKKERDNYTYAVACVDSKGKESQRGAALPGITPNVPSQGKLAEERVDKINDKKKFY